MAHQGQKIKEKIKHFLHHDKPVTTPDASPGHADDGIQQAQATTTNVPEAFYPGSVPVVPKETHSTAPYSSALGQHQAAPESNQAPWQPTAVPADPAAMMGAPPSGKDSKDVVPPEENNAAPVSYDKGLKSSSEEPEQIKGEEELEVQSGTKDYSPADESDVQTKGTELSRQIEDSPGSESKEQTEDYSPGAESDEQTKQTEAGMQIEDSLDNESKVQTDDYPVTDSVVEEKDDNPRTDSEGEKTGQEFDPVNEEKTEEKSTSAQPTTNAYDQSEQKSAQENA